MAGMCRCEVVYLVDVKPDSPVYKDPLGLSL